MGHTHIGENMVYDLSVVQLLQESGIWRCPAGTATRMYKYLCSPVVLCPRGRVTEKFLRKVDTSFLQTTTAAN